MRAKYAYVGLSVVVCLGIYLLMPSALPPASAARDYPWASKAPPENWNVTVSWPDMTLRELCLQAHSVVWVNVDTVEERWKWDGMEWSRYKVTVQRYILNRKDTSQTTLSVVQHGGGQEIYFNYHHLQPGRSYILVLVSYEAGGRLNENYLLHPVGLYPLIADDVVECWYPPPWGTKDPYLQVDELLLRVTGGS